MPTQQKNELKRIAYKMMCVGCMCCGGVFVEVCIIMFVIV